MTSPAAPIQPSPDQPVPDEFDLLCEGCGYSLIGLMSDRCPECGEPFDASLLPLARVPWLYRRRLGKVWSFIVTCWRILFHPTDFAAEMCRPIRISMQDARLFRRLCIRIVMATAIVLTAAGAVINLSWSQALVDLRREGITGCTMLIAAIVFGVILSNVLLRLATDLPTFIWQGLAANPNDLAPLHYYAAAPLALVPVVAVPGCMLLQYAQHLGGVYKNQVELATLAVMVLGGIGILAWLWWIPLFLMKEATGCSFRRVIALAVYLPVHWVLMLAMCSMAYGVAIFVLSLLLTGRWP